MLVPGGVIGREGGGHPDPEGPVDGGQVRRGDIHAAELGDCDSEGGKTSRPVLVIQNDVGNRYSNTVIVACVASSIIARDFPLIVKIANGSVPGLAGICLNQIITVEKDSLGKKLASLPAETMAKVDEALRLSLGLPRVG